MPSSTNKGYTQPIYNTEIGTWGTDVNNNLTGIIDLNLGGFVNVPLSSSNVTLTTGASGEMQNLIINLTGTLLANVTVYSAAVGFYIVENLTSGSYTVNWQADFGGGGIGTSFTIPQGYRGLFFTDTTNGARCVSWLPAVKTESLLASTSGATPATMARTENDTTERAVLAIQSGTGAGDAYNLRIAGDGSNGVANVRQYIGSTEITDVSASLFDIVAPIGFPSPLTFPQGRLTLTSAAPICTSDVTGTSTIYWTPYGGNRVPVWNGSSFSHIPFSEITLTLTSAMSANSIVDIFAAISSGSLVIGFGPTWADATPGSGSRGTGAGTTQLARKNGLLTNAVTISLTNGGTTYSGIAVNEATYLGSVYADGTAAQTSCYWTTGQNHKWGVWNAYNKFRVVISHTDSNSSWSYGTGTWRASNNDSNNSVLAFAGIAEEAANITFKQFLTSSASGVTDAYIGIGVNSTSSTSGSVGSGRFQQGAANSGSNLVANYILPPFLGVVRLTSLEYSSSSETFHGSDNMVFQAEYNA